MIAQAPRPPAALQRPRQRPAAADRAAAPARTAGKSAAFGRRIIRRGRVELEREHSISLYTCVHRPGVEERLPLVAIDGDVDLEQGLAQVHARARADIDKYRPAVYGDRQLLAGQVGRTHVRPGSDVTE